MLEKIADLLWDYPMLILLMGTHIFMSVKTGFIQKKLPLAIKLSFEKEKNTGGGIGQFSALATSLASTVGTGNILGTATAIAIGGPGAVFWIWFSGIFAIATKYAETYTAVKYRIKKEDGSYCGGAMYTLQNVLKMKWLGKLFAFFAMFTALCIGCSLQSNAIISTLANAVNMERFPTVNIFGVQISVLIIAASVILTVISAAAIFGGLSRITKLCEKVVPAMAAIFLIGCFSLLFINRSFIMPSISLIISSAFSLKAGAGSCLMLSFRMGVSRGLFSNEAGVGSSPMVSACTGENDAVKTSLIASGAVFWDTLVICLITGIVMVSSSLAGDFGTDLNGSQLASLAFSKVPFLGNSFLLLCLLIFAFSTILGWSVYGIQSAVYLFGERAQGPYKFFWIVTVFISCFADVESLWTLGEILNALMAIPNIFTVFMLSGEIRQDTKEYFRKKRTAV